MRLLTVTQVYDELKQTTSHADYFQGYLNDLGVQQSLVEEEYVDKEYLIDYCNFHARSFKPVHRFTERYHFFTDNFTEEWLRNTLATGDKIALEHLQTHYLGFMVVKPVTNRQGKRLVGRSILRPYPDRVDSDRRVLITQDHWASLFGIPLKINALPYQTQDAAVGVCASTALWISLFPMARVVDAIPLLALAEITSKASEFPGSRERRFPSHGLTIPQILGFIRSLGLEADILSLDYLSNPPISLIPDFIKSYIECGIPIIAGLSLWKKDDTDEHVRSGLHAVVISGYRCDENRNLTELYVHDDQIGPYSRVLPTVSRDEKDFTNWRNEWLDHGYNEVQVEQLIAPVYPKIRLSFSDLYTTLEATRQGSYLRQSDVEFELFLSTIKTYKEKLLRTLSSNYKVEFLTKSTPRFIWVMRAHRKGQPITDWLYDATLPYATPSPFDIIEFQRV